MTLIARIPHTLLCTLLTMSAGTTFAAQDNEAPDNPLTAFGAVQGANADGSIPAYTGGLTTAPASYTSGSGVRPDPFANDAPLLRIDAHNMAQYADQLTEGTKALLNTYPSMYMDIYPTRRSVAYPAKVLENTRKNIQRAHSTEGGLAVEGALAGFPFPLPADGQQIMWNHLLAYSGAVKDYSSQTWIVAGNSAPLLSLVQKMHVESPFYQADGGENTEKYYSKAVSETTEPARNAGQKILFYKALNPTEGGDLSWSYVPSQRRVRQLPDYVYDSPIGSAGGYMVIDDAGLFSGALDRFDFKKIGKKEVFIPYNTYNALYGCPTEQLLKPGVLAPQCIRWEKHRVWVVEADLKPGLRHIYSKRLFYWDEDSYLAGATENYDSSGKLYKVGYSLMAPAYEVPAPMADTTVFYDLTAKAYVLYNYAGQSGGYKFTQPWPAKALTSQAMAGAGIR